MIGLVGYNFCGDSKSLDPFPSSIKNVKITKLQGGIYDHIRISSEITSDYDATIPENWDFDTILDCNFENNVEGGNLSQSASGISGVRFKRRKKNEFDWITIKQYDDVKIAGLNLIFNDNLVQDGVDYEYAFVPLISRNNTIQEGTYTTVDVVTKFQGVYLCDLETIFKFYARVAYGGTDRVQQVGSYEVLGQRYPIMISNGLINYDTGSVTGLVLPENYEDTRVLDGKDISSQSRRLLEFLTNGKPKMLKDVNGNSWLCYISGNPQLTYEDSTFNKVITANFTWTQTGDPGNKEDLIANGMIPEEA